MSAFYMISLFSSTKSISNMFQADHAQHILVNDLDALPFLLQLLEHHMMAANGSPTSVPHWPSIRAILGLVSELPYPWAMAKCNRIRIQKIFLDTKKST